MKRKIVLIFVLTLAMLFGVVSPQSVTLAKGENNVTAQLTTSATTVSPPNTVVWTYIKVTNTDPTYTCDVTVKTPGGLLIDSFSLGAGASKTVNHVENITETREVYYVVLYSHAPDMSQSKNTNKVTITYDDGSGSSDGGSSSDDMGDAPDMHDDMTVVHKSGAVFQVVFDNAYYDGRYLPDSANHLVGGFDAPVTMSADMHCNLSDDIASGYLDRAEEDRVTIDVSWRVFYGGTYPSRLGSETFVLTEDDQVFDVTRLLDFPDIYELTDDEPDYVYLFATMTDPVTGARATDFITVFIYPDDPSGSYTLRMGRTLLNGIVVDPDEVLPVARDEEFIIEQYIYYTVPAYEISLPEFVQVQIEAGCDLHVFSRYEERFSAPQLSADIEDTSGMMIFTIHASQEAVRGSVLAPSGADDIHTFEIFATQVQNDMLPFADNSALMDINIQLVDEVSIDDYPIPDVFDRLVWGGSIWDWVGLTENIITVIPDETNIMLDAPGFVELTGTIEYNSNFYHNIRVSAYDGFEVHSYNDLTESAPPSSGIIPYSLGVYADESMELSIVGNLNATGGGSLDSSAAEVSITVMPSAAVPSRHRLGYTLTSTPMIISEGESAMIDYSLTNTYYTEAIHLRFIDDSDSSIINEDVVFILYEEMTGSIEVNPAETTTYSYTAQVLDSGGSVVWEETKSTTVFVMEPMGYWYTPDDAPAYHMEFALAASSTVISSGDSVDVTATLANFGSEFVEVEIYNEDGTYFGDGRGVLHPDDTTSLTETMTFDETTTLSLRASAYSEGVEIYTETADITIVVDTDAAFSPYMMMDGGEAVDLFNIDFSVIPSNRTIMQGDSTDLFISYINLGIAPLNVTISEVGGDVIYRGENIAGGQRVDNVLPWSPDETSLKFIGLVAQDPVTGVSYMDVTAVMVEVLTEEPDSEYSIDLVVNVNEEDITLGDTVDIDIDFINTGTSDISEYILSETLTGSSTYGDNLLSGEAIHVDVDGWGLTRTTTVVYLLTAYDADGELVASDNEAITVNVTTPMREEDDPVPMDDVGGEADIEDDIMLDTPPAEIEDTLSDMGIELSIASKPASRDLAADESDSRLYDEMKQVYNISRLIVILVLVVILMIFVLVAVFGVRVARRGKKN